MSTHYTTLVAAKFDPDRTAVYTTIYAAYFSAIYPTNWSSIFSTNIDSNWSA
jgi:hypothetical protein